MKIISLDLNTAVLIGGPAESYNCFKNCILVLQHAYKVYNSLQPYDSSTSGSLESYKDNQLICCEDLLSALNTPGIEDYFRASLSKHPSLFGRLEQFRFLREQLYEFLGQIVDAYISLTSEEIATILQLVIGVLQQLIFFTYYEFNFDKSMSSVAEGDELLLNETVNNYCGKEGIRNEEILYLIADLYAAFRPSIPSFDLDEETIDNFYFFAGIHSYEVLDNIDQLDIQDIIDIANETKSVEEVIVKINNFSNIAKGVNKIDLFGTN